MLPIGRWKKQGRTVPSDSTTADTHGALHLGAIAGICPRRERKRSGMRRSFSAFSTTKPDSISFSYSEISASISLSSAATSAVFNATVA